MSTRLARRRFLRVATLTAAGAALAACRPPPVAVTGEAEKVVTPKVEPTVTPKVEKVQEPGATSETKTLRDIYEGVVNGNRDAVTRGIEIALGDGVPPWTLLMDVLVPAMAEVGERFEKQEYFVPEMLLSARAMQAGMDTLKPLLVKTGIEPVARVAMGTVKGDLHDIGKNLVSTWLEAAGFEVIDLGVDAFPAAFVKAAQNGADIIAISSLITTTMPSMKTTIDALIEAGVRKTVKIMVGGAPVTQAYADQIGADGYAPDAQGAVQKAQELLGI